MLQRTLKISANFSFKTLSLSSPSIRFTTKFVKMGLICSASLGLIFSLFVMIVHCQPQIDLTFLHSAVAKGAVCLDGSAPAYSYTKGSGEGSHNWIIYLQGGGWCVSIEDCRNRSSNHKGSSHLFPNQTSFSGILESNQLFNPNFYNWHKAFIYYCDGASFLADIKQSVSYLNFRGARIFKVMMEEMLSMGMKNARNAILAGTSAGGLATSLHCDGFRELFLRNTIVKCISDSGFFIKGVGLRGAEGRAEYFAQVVATHGLNDSLPVSCTKKMNSNLCILPENFVGDIQTPLFLIESAFDAYQIANSIVPEYYGGVIAWRDCINNLTICRPTQLNIMKVDWASCDGLILRARFTCHGLVLRPRFTCDDRCSK